MPYTTLVAGTTITASWANANVRDQVVTPFANNSARSSAITSPIAGMLSYLTGTKQVEPYDGSAWVPMPGTIVAWAQRLTDKTFTGVEVGVLRLDNVPLRNGYRYLVMSSSLRISPFSGETGRSNLRYSLVGSATTADTVLGGVESQVNTAFTPSNSPTIVTSLNPGSNVTASFLLCLDRSGGTNNVTMTGNVNRPIELYVIMLGPDPTDTGIDI